MVQGSVTSTRCPFSSRYQPSERGVSVWAALSVSLSVGEGIRKQAASAAIRPTRTSRYAQAERSLNPRMAAPPFRKNWKGLISLF